MKTDAGRRRPQAPGRKTAERRIVTPDTPPRSPDIPGRAPRGPSGTETCQPPSGHPDPWRPPVRQPPGREQARAEFLEKERVEASRRCCQNCAFATRPKGKWWRLILLEFPNLLACLNHPDARGEMTETISNRVCRNFRYRHQPSFRLEAPESPGPGVRVIALTKGKHALVDAEHYDRIAKHKWTAYYTTGKWYAGRTEKGKGVLMHREIMKAPKGKVVDHIDGNGLNNCKSNLRLCTYGQNNVHRRPRGDSSRFKCVYRDEKRNLWRSTPAYLGRSVYNGRYENELDAARASDYMNVQLNGEFAYLNFPAEWPQERIREVHAQGQTLRDKLEAERRDKQKEAKGKGKRVKGQTPEAPPDPSPQSSTTEDPARLSDATTEVLTQRH